MNNNIPEFNPPAKMEFSKKILYMVFITTAIIIVFSMVLMWKTNDTTPLAYLIPALFVEVSTVSGFYFWKSKMENKIKLEAVYGKAAVQQAEQSETQTQWNNNNHDNFI